MGNIIAPKDRETHVYRAYQRTTLDKLLEFSYCLRSDDKSLKPLH